MGVGPGLGLSWLSEGWERAEKPPLPALREEGRRATVKPQKAMDTEGLPPCRQLHPGKGI